MKAKFHFYIREFVFGQICLSQQYHHPLYHPLSSLPLSSYYYHHHHHLAHVTNLV